MGNSHSVRKINFEDMQNFIKDASVIIINTLPSNKQVCLISNTILASEETKILNDELNKNYDRIIVVYGMNSSDEVIVSKYNQLIKLGFHNVYVYPGGLFEWLLLQDIYGTESFPTTKKELDILQYKGDCLEKRLTITY